MKMNALVGIALMAGLAIVLYFVLHREVDTGKVTTPIATATYLCDTGKEISAAYYQGPAAPMPKPEEPPTPTGWVEVAINGAASTTLRQTVSADGARYGNADESLVFWSKGETALIMRNNSMDLTYTNCVAAK